MRKVVLSFLSVLLLLGCKSNSNKDSAKIEMGENNRNTLCKQDSLAIELIELFGSDQIARRNNRIFTSLDSINFNVLVDFVKKNGLPNKELLGERYMKIEAVAAAPTSVLLHNPHRLVNEKQHLDLFLREVDKGNMSREFLATVLDKYYWVRKDQFGNRKLLYGTQFGKPCIKYRRESDSVRNIIGLYPLPDSLFMDCK